VGSDFSYSVLVEPGGRLFINDQAVVPPDDVVTSSGDPLEWALDKVRETYAGFYAKDQNSALTLTVRDRRPGGAHRRLRVTDPSRSISLDGLRGGLNGVENTESSRAEPDKDVEQEQDTSEPAANTEIAESLAVDGEGATSVTENRGDEKGGEGSIAADEVGEQDGPSLEGEVPIVEAEPEPIRGRGRNWKRLDPQDSARPKINPTDAAREGRGWTEQRSRARWRMAVRVTVALVVAAVIAVGVGFALQGVEYDAFCVDRRTLTRASSGTACAGTDTNYSWWYVEESDQAPEVGETVDREVGSFDEPGGLNITITKHMT